MSTDAIVLLKEDHTEIRRLFREFEGTGKDATKAKGALVTQILSLLTVHTYLENEIVYPGVRELEHRTQRPQPHHQRHPVTNSHHTLAPFPGTRLSCR